MRDPVRHSRECAELREFIVVRELESKIGATEVENTRGARICNNTLGVSAS